MKHCNGFIFFSGIFFLFLVISLVGQTNNTKEIKSIYPKFQSHNPNFIVTDSLSFYQQKGEWQKIIDEFWGKGLSFNEKKSVFNTFADKIQAQFPCFTDFPPLIGTH